MGLPTQTSVLVKAARQMYDYAATRVAADRILVPSLLGLVIAPAKDKAS